MDTSTDYTVTDDPQQNYTVADTPLLPVEERVKLASVKNAQRGKTMVKRRALFAAFNAMHSHTAQLQAMR